MKNMTERRMRSSDIRSRIRFLVNRSRKKCRSECVRIMLADVTKTATSNGITIAKKDQLASCQISPENVEIKRSIKA